MHQHSVIGNNTHTHHHHRLPSALSLPIDTLAHRARSHAPTRGPGARCIYWQPALATVARLSQCRSGRMRTGNSAMKKENLREEDFKLYHQLLYRGKGLHVAERERAKERYEPNTSVWCSRANNRECIVSDLPSLPAPPNPQ